MGLLTADNRRDTVRSWLFVAVQFALLALVVLLPGGDAWPVPRWLDTVGLVLQLVGAAVLLLGIVGLGRSVTPLPTPTPHATLRVGGLYRFVRHPIYAGLDALVVGAAVRAASWWVALAALALVGWLMVKARWEEGHLRNRYPEYADYAARTPRFVPFLPLRSARR